MRDEHDFYCNKLFFSVRTPQKKVILTIWDETSKGSLFAIKKKSSLITDFFLKCFLL